VTGLRAVALGAAAFVAMEPLTALLHRAVFHGPGMFLHRSHHRPPTGLLEANDLFPVALAGMTVLAMALGTSVGTLAALVPAAVGVTVYGAAYATVHDLYIHRRLPLLPERVGFLEPLRRAHAVHHRYGGAPYGMLWPVVPAARHAQSADGPEAIIRRPATASLRARGTRARRVNTS
jgi:beta-carotene 3-hydroxylase